MATISQKLLAERKKKREEELRRDKEAKPKPVPTERTPEGQAELKAQMERDRARTSVIRTGMTPEEREELETRREQAGEVFEEKEIFEEQRPQKTELDTALIQRPGAEKFKESVPILGPALMALSEISLSTTGIFPGGRSPIREEIKPLIQDPQTSRELALQAIQQEVIDEGLSISEIFGATIEAIPIAGGLVSRYARGLIETPKGNVNTIVTQISQIESRSSNIREKALTGKISPYVAIDELERMQLDLAKLEQRIHILSLVSAELQADPDEINRIEEKILSAKERVFDAKQSAAGGAITPASDGNVYLSLLELQKEREKRKNEQ